MQETCGDWAQQQVVLKQQLEKKNLTFIVILL